MIPFNSHKQNNCMKKYLLIFFLSTTFLHAQDLAVIKKSEVRIDVLALITYSKFNVSYERYLGKHFSLGLSTSYSNSNKTNEDFDAGYRNTIPKYEVNPFLRYNFSNNLSRFYFAEIFMSANGGDFKETVRIDDGTYTYFENQKSTYFDFAMGGSLGYKMYFKKKFAVEFLVGFGKNLINTDKSPDVMSRVGLNFGYRF